MLKIETKCTKLVKKCVYKVYRQQNCSIKKFQKQKRVRSGFEESGSEMNAEREINNDVTGYSLTREWEERESKLEND